VAALHLFSYDYTGLERVHQSGMVELVVNIGSFNVTPTPSAKLNGRDRIGTKVTTAPDLNMAELFAQRLAAGDTQGTQGTRDVAAAAPGGRGGWRGGDGGGVERGGGKDKKGLGVTWRLRELSLKALFYLAASSPVCFQEVIRSHVWPTLHRIACDSTMSVDSRIFAAALLQKIVEEDKESHVELEKEMVDELLLSFLDSGVENLQCFGATTLVRIGGNTVSNPAVINRLVGILLLMAKTTKFLDVQACYYIFISIFYIFSLYSV
jgi:hypothetical protein